MTKSSKFSLLTKEDENGFLKVINEGNKNTYYLFCEPGKNKQFLINTMNEHDSYEVHNQRDLVPLLKYGYFILENDIDTIRTVQLIHLEMMGLWNN